MKKTFKNVEVLKGISFTVKEGEVLVIIGASGSGKSTVLRCINQLEKMDDGNVKIKENSMIQEKKKDKLVYSEKAVLEQMNLACGMVFQNFNLFPHLSIMDNVLLAMEEVLKIPKEEAIQKAAKILERMGLQDKIKQYPCNLSGGQQQRASIARTLAIEPEILFMDEPTSALDPELVGEVLKVIQQLAKENRTM